MLCAEPNMKCHLNECEKCHEVNGMEQFFEQILEDNQMESIPYKQWVNQSGRTGLENITRSSDDFIRSYSMQLATLIPHDFIAKKQSDFLKMKKDQLRQGEFIVISDFAEKLSLRYSDSMGGTNTKRSSKGSVLLADESPIVNGCFKNVSKNSDKIKEDELMKFWGSQMDPRLAQYITNYLFGPLATRISSIDIKRFAELYVYCVRGTVEERTNVLFGSLGQHETETPDIAYPLIKEYVEAVVSSYMRALRLRADARYKSWETKNFKIVKDSVQKLGESLVYEVVQQGTQRVTRMDAEKWLESNPIFLKMISHVFYHLYSYRVTSSKPTSVHDTGSSRRRQSTTLPTDPFKSSETNLLPMSEGLLNTPQFPPFVDISQIIYINANLPVDYQDKWRFLFSSQMHGESFSTFLGRIQHKGSTIVIVEDSNGFVFGGFAPAEWALSPNFVGNDTSFLFTLKPKMRCFESSGYNEHYQYLNLHQQTMPNGLGMGGQFDYWGLWIDSDYGNGQCSESCTTYSNYIQLSPSKQFKIKNIEVWGVGDIPIKEEDEESSNVRTTKRSILDSNPENKAMLEMVGVVAYSGGLREEVEE